MRSNPLIIVFFVILYGCGPTIDENGLGAETEPFSEDLILKYSEFKLDKTYLAFCIEGDFRFCLIRLKKVSDPQNFSRLVSLTNQVYENYHSEYEFTELFILTQFTEYRFEKIPVDINNFKTDTVLGGEKDTLIHVR